MFLAALCVIGLSTAGPARADVVDEYLRAEMVRSAIPRTPEGVLIRRSR